MDIGEGRKMNEGGEQRKEEGKKERGGKDEGRKKKLSKMKNCSQAATSNVSCLYPSSSIKYIITKSFVNFAATSAMPKHFVRYSRSSINMC